MPCKSPSHQAVAKRCATGAQPFKAQPAQNMEAPQRLIRRSCDRNDRNQPSTQAGIRLQQQLERAGSAMVHPLKRAMPQTPAVAASEGCLQQQRLGPWPLGPRSFSPRPVSPELLSCRQMDPRWLKSQLPSSPVLDSQRLSSQRLSSRPLNSRLRWTTSAPDPPGSAARG